VAGLSLLSARLVQIQLVDRKEYAASASRAYQRTEKLPAVRGMIVDRHEEPLAKSIPVATVSVDKNHLRDPEVASFGLAYQQASAEPGWAELDAGKRRSRIYALRRSILANESREVIVEKHLAYAVGVLARPLGMRRDELREKINLEQVRPLYFPIAKDLPQDVADRLREAVREHWIQGFDVDNSIKRWYTAPTVASHLIGFTGEVEEKDEEGKKHPKVVGRSGIEAAMEDYLAGRDGWRKHQRDSYGLVVPGGSNSLMPPRAGLNVQLTLDMGIQAIVEEELDAALAEFNSIRGTVVLLDPKTGQVLAMASRPTFDLNRRENIAENGFNYAIQAAYEPGSTIKLVSAAGTVNEGLVSPLTSVFCHNGYFADGSVVVRDQYPASYLTVEGILQKSNNIGAYKLGRQLGSRRFYQYVHGFGFGKKTGIMLSGESGGIARDTSNAVDFSRATFGYAMSVTPLQMANAYAAVGYDGKLRKPQVVKALVANDGTIVEEFPPEVLSEVVKPETAKKMRLALEKVTQRGGTATLAAVPGFRVGGKTGTARKHNPNGRGYLANRYIVSFVGMMPVEDPAFVAVVVIDDPRTDKVKAGGGTMAAPTFGKIAARVAARMNLQPTEPVPPPLARSSE
jgi:cell division protein FtsI/penicillin-binding protein 2